MSDLMLKLFVQLQTLRAREEGQGMVEYALILVLVSIFALVALRTIGTNVNTVFGSINSALTGA
jgi:pilus assembly protein Flp/PilA